MVPDGIKKTDFSRILAEVADFERGLAPHYPILWALVVGLEARHVVEIGCGASTRVLLDALAVTGGTLWSFSAETRETIIANFLGWRDPQPWRHASGLTSETLHDAHLPHTVDLVLHDGSHSTSVVMADLSALIPRLAAGGLLLVHDTLHAYVGPQVRLAVSTLADMWRMSRVTLPFAYGLTILQRRQLLDGAPLGVQRRKAGSPHGMDLAELDQLP